MALLKVEGVVSGYTKELDILKGVSLTVEERQKVSIIGPNGAGKSTVLKTIFGILKPKQGHIFFKNDEITGASPRALLHKGMCFVPQGQNLFPLMLVEENLELGAFIEKDKVKRKCRVDEVYQLFPRLKERRTQKAASLSGGEIQLLEIGRALLLDPDLILLDEPSLGLSPIMAEEVFKRIEQINKERNVAMLIVEQNADRSLRMTDYAYVLETGLNKYEGPAEDIRTDQRIKKLYLGG